MCYGLIILECVFKYINTFSKGSNLLLVEDPKGNHAICFLVPVQSINTIVLPICQTHYVLTHLTQYVLSFYKTSAS